MQKSRGFFVLAMCLGTLLTTMSSLSFAQSPAPGEIKIKRFTATGTACKKGKIAVNLSPDSQALTLLFDDFIVEAKPNKALDIETCAVRIALDVPTGWTFAIFNVDVRGYVSLERGLEANQKIVLDSAHSVRERDTMTFVGPYDGDYIHSANIAVTSKDWLPCNRRNNDHNLLVKASGVIKRNRDARRDGLKPIGIMTVDSLDGHLSQTYRLAWSRCARP